MADNVILNPGSGGATIAADLVNGAYYQDVKVGFGVNDSWTYVSASNGLPVAQQGSWAVTVNASTSGGGTPYHLVSAASTNPTSVKSSAGQVFSMAGYNTNASPRYLKLFDKATAPTPGTDVPVWVMMLPGNASGAGANLSLPIGLVFASGVAFAITGGIADNDSTTIGAGDCVIDLLYK